MAVKETLCKLFGHKISRTEWVIWKIKNNPINVMRHGYSPLTCPRCGCVWNLKEGDLKRKRFVIEKHTNVDKRFSIYAPTDLSIDISVDFDDVDHAQVNKISKKIVEILNDNLDKLLCE